jgi:hypothetical protein
VRIEKYYLEMLLFAVLLPMAFILLGIGAMWVLEPVPEFGGYVHQWSRTVRSIISVLLIVVAFQSARIHRQARCNSANSSQAGKSAVYDSDECRSVESVAIALLVFFVWSIVSTLLIFENSYGGGIDAL